MTDIYTYTHTYIHTYIHTHIQVSYDCVCPPGSFPLRGSECSNSKNKQLHNNYMRYFNKNHAYNANNDVSNNFINNNNVLLNGKCVFSFMIFFYFVVETSISKAVS